MRVIKHPVLGDMDSNVKWVKISVDGETLDAIEGEPIAAALSAYGIRTFRFTARNREPRGIFCEIGRCTDCAMTVDGVPNVRTCVTAVREGMVINTQEGLGKWGDPR
jgi:predicted molibdopterin-dependent oxidoreductase YjgC